MKYRKHISELDKKHTKDITDAYKNSCKKLFEKIRKNAERPTKSIEKGKNVGVGSRGGKNTKKKKSNNLVNNTIRNGISELIGKLEIQEIKKR